MAASSSWDGISADTRVAIELFVDFRLRQGAAFEKLVREKQANNPRFTFLFDTASPMHDYYLHVYNRAAAEKGERRDERVPTGRPSPNTEPPPTSREDNRSWPNPKPTRPPIDLPVGTRVAVLLNTERGASEEPGTVTAIIPDGFGRLWEVQHDGYNQPSRYDFESTKRTWRRLGEYERSPAASVHYQRDHRRMPGSESYDQDSRQQRHGADEQRHLEQRYAPRADPEPRLEPERVERDDGLAAFCSKIEVFDPTKPPPKALNAERLKPITHTMKMDHPTVAYICGKKMVGLFRLQNFTGTRIDAGYDTLAISGSPRQIELILFCVNIILKGRVDGMLPIAEIESRTDVSKKVHGSHSARTRSPLHACTLLSLLAVCTVCVVQVSMLEVPCESVGYVLGTGGESLRKKERTYGVFMFFDNSRVRGGADKGVPRTKRLYIIGEESRREAAYADSKDAAISRADSSRIAYVDTNSSKNFRDEETAEWILRNQYSAGLIKRHDSPPPERSRGRSRSRSRSRSPSPVGDWAGRDLEYNPSEVPRGANEPPTVAVDEAMAMLKGAGVDVDLKQRHEQRYAPRRGNLEPGTEQDDLGRNDALAAFSSAPWRR